MKAEITFSQLVWNKGLYNFFFREQSKNTFEELIDNVEESFDDVCKSVDNFADTYQWSVDEIEEAFYGLTIDELIDCFELTKIDN